MLKRWWIYLSEQFPPVLNILFALILYLDLSFMLQAMLGMGNLTITTDILPGVATIVLILLYYRICDEFKDAEVDRKYFPERPIPSGRVLMEDLKVLGWITVITLFCINFIWPVALIPFLILFIYAYLMGKWFFLESAISGNRFLAFITHGPISIIANLYILAIICRRIHEPILTADTLFIAVWFSLASFALEFARKTRAPFEEEEGYQTYSALIGFKGSVAVAASFVILQFILLMAKQDSLHLSGIFLSFYSLIVIGHLISLLKFVMVPEKGTKGLRTVTEIYTTLTYVGILAELIISRGVAW